MMEIKIPYYEDNTRLSNSGIGWFLKKGPRYYKDMIDGKEEGLKLPQLERGTMIHEYILQPDEFWNDYTILEYEVPKVKQQKDFCERYTDLKLIKPLDDENSILLEAYNSAYNNTKIDQNKLLEATNLVKKFNDYIEYLQKKQSKKVISFADLNMLKNIKKNIDEHKKANELLTNDPGCECHNEFHINWEDPKYKLPCKSLLDRVKIDHVNKRITVIDLKTTADVYNFKHSVETYDYYRQIAFYLLAITWYMNDQEIDISDYDCEAYIIAIQTNSNNEVRVFNMLNENELMNSKDIIFDTLSELSYHYQSNNWDHTRNYYENDGTEEL